MAWYYVITVAKIAIPILLSLSLFLFIAGMTFRRKDKLGQDRFDKMLDLVGKSEIDSQIETYQDRVGREKRNLNAWSRLWLNSFESGGYKTEDMKAPGQIMLTVMVGGGIVGFLIAGGLGVFLAMLAIPVLTYMWNDSKFQVRTSKMDTQLLGLSQSMEQNVTAGSIPTDAFISAVSDVSDPLRTELDNVVNEVKSGTTLPAALESFADKTDSREIKFFSSAMKVSIEKGADIVPQLQTITSKLETRQKLRQKINEAVSRQRIMIIMAMVITPLGLFISQSGFLGGKLDEETGEMVAPSWMDSPTTMAIFVACLAMWAIGLFFMNRSVTKMRKF